MEVSLETGRTHQIRVHAAHLGHPVAGDERYGDEAFNKTLRAEAGLKRLFLHAHRLTFSWVGEEELDISTPLPDELSQVLNRLKSPGKRRRR